VNLSGKAPDGCSAAAVVTMAVVPFKQARRGRRLSLRHYICTEAGLFRVTSRLAREMAHREVAVPQFANSIQRFVEVFVDTVAGKIVDVQIRPTHARFDEQGRADLNYAAEAMAVFVDALEPTKVRENLFDINGKLKAIRRERETQWRIDRHVKKAIMADISGETKLPLFRLR
jgi:hypothetical protein